MGITAVGQSRRAVAGPGHSSPSTVWRTRAHLTMAVYIQQGNRLIEMTELFHQIDQVRHSYTRSRAHPAWTLQERQFITANVGYHNSGIDPTYMQPCNPP